MKLDYSVTLANNEIASYPGEIVAAWGFFNPNGPTLYSLGYTEASGDFDLFYRWQHFMGGRTYLIGNIGEHREIVGSDDFGEIIFHAILRTNNTFAASGEELPPFSSIPSFLIFNENEGVRAAIREIIRISPAFLEADWGKQLYLLAKYRNDLFGRAGEEFREAYERERKDPKNQTMASKELLDSIWARYQHIATFRDWQPGRYAYRPFDRTSFDNWWETVTDAEFIFPQATAHFLHAWIGAVSLVGDSLIDKLRAEDKYESAESVYAFFAAYSMSLGGR